MTEQDSNRTTGTITIEGEGARFYQGVATGAEIAAKWEEVFEEQNVDLETRLKVFWFYVGMAAVIDHGLSGTDDLTTYLTGAALRAPDPSRVSTGDPVRDHLYEISKDAGLGMMTGIFDVLMDREEVPEERLLALDESDVTEFYESMIGPVVDRIQRRLS